MKGKALQVLLVEDSAGDARLLREMFRTETPGSFVLTHVERMSDALSHLAKAPGVDILLVDMGLPDGRGLDWLLEPTGRNVDESMEDFGQRVAMNLQELMNQEFSLRMVKNEQ
jgi:CheY-like chemotaxis protein